MKKILLAVLIVGFIVTGFSMNIVETAISAGNFTTLVKAVQEAGLVDALMGEGPFTVFAPTDDAFAKLPEGTIEGLLNDIPVLTNILLYHVVPGYYLAEDVVSMRSLTTLLGQNITVHLLEEVKIDNAGLVATDIIAANGVIHIIDTVIIPMEGEDCL